MKDLKSKGKTCGKFSDCNPKFGSKGTSKDSGDEADEEEDSRMRPTKTKMNTCCFFCKKKWVYLSKITEMCFLSMPCDAPL